MIIKSKSLGIILVIFIFGGILLSTWMNWWQTESDKTPIRFSEGEFQGEFDPSDIRGSYTFGDIQNSFDIPIEVLAAAFGIAMDPDVSAYQVNGLETLFADSEYEIGTSSIRLFVAWYKGLPFEITEEIYLPESAVRLLFELGSLNQDQIDYLENHRISSNNFTNLKPDQIQLESDDQPDDGNEKIIKGKTTFREVLDWGVSREIIENILGGKIINPLEKIKDYCISHGLEFETIKLKIQTEVDNNP
ncbi:MAG TPA: hypothetical protein VJZ78_01040 [Anaerolineales bacterium]|nr:hypothetical protein [Anaerolineales bacterium]